ncbi:type II toxin-antitoxin system VapC family toxin [Glaciihabitans sp. UYNi722]|uniref:type II toxin-antitoxin system VapC family toxin n=1 Tax=Glaciihabitans sp. UYNi722 TaxID=3156344 RepID=UPI0033924316
MRALLDTNALYWLMMGSPHLGPSARKAIENAAVIVVSEVSLLEIAIKVSIGKLPAMPSLYRVIQEAGFQRTGISDDYLHTLETLPLHHRDPFDRLLIAQSLTDDLTVITADLVFGEYGVPMIDARA